MEYVHGFSMGKRYEEPKEYATIIRSTIEKLLRDASGRYDAEDGWQLALEKQGVTIYRKKSIKIKGKRTIDSIKGRAEFKVNAKEFCELVTNLGEDRKRIDHFFKQGKIVKNIDEATSIVYYEIQAKKCIANMHRDLLFMQHTRELGSGVWIVASRSAGVSQDLVPPAQNCTRAELLTSGWVVRPLKDGRCEIVYIVQADLGNLPETVINILAKQQPLLIARAAAFLIARNSSVETAEANSQLSPRTRSKVMSELLEIPYCEETADEVSDEELLEGLVMEAPEVGEFNLSVHEPSELRMSTVQTRVSMSAVNDTDSLSPEGNPSPVPRKLSPRLGAIQSDEGVLSRSGSGVIIGRKHEVGEESPRGDNVSPRRNPQVPPNSRVNSVMVEDTRPSSAIGRKNDGEESPRENSTSSSSISPRIGRVAPLPLGASRDKVRTAPLPLNNVSATPTAFTPASPRDDRSAAGNIKIGSRSPRVGSPRTSPRGSPRAEEK